MPISYNPDAATNIKIAPCRYCGSTNVYFFGSLPGQYGFSHTCSSYQPVSRQGTNEITYANYADSLSAQRGWNDLNDPDQPETPLEPDIPALDLSRRARRGVEIIKPLVEDKDLGIIEIEIGYKEMRSYKTPQGMFTNREETAILRARVGEGQSAESVAEALRQKAGQLVSQAHAQNEQTDAVNLSVLKAAQKEIDRDFMGLATQLGVTRPDENRRRNSPSYFSGNSDMQF